MPNSPFMLEVCLDSATSAIAAQTGGAHRVELCGNLSEGGVTPSAGAIEIVRKNITIGLHVLIRPRVGDFFYSDVEFEVMKKDIATAKCLGANGVVIGILNDDGSIDTLRTRMLVELARPMTVTFHRAFDVAKNPLHAFEDVISVGVNRLLTSGQQPTATEGSTLIAELVSIARGRIVVMPGCGIQESNVRTILEKTGANEIHIGSAVHNRAMSTSMGNGITFGSLNIVDVTKVQCILQTCREVMAKSFNRTID